jgi:hypothetical protein
MADTTTERSRWLVLIQLAITNQKRASVERGCSKVLTFSQRSETAPWIRQDPKPLRTPAGTANFGGVAGSTSLTGTHQANCSVWSKMLPDDFRTLGQLEGHHCRGIRRDCRFTTSGTGPSRPPTPRYARPPQMAADTDVTADSKCIERPSPRWFSARRASMGPRSIDRGTPAGFGVPGANGMASMGIERCQGGPRTSRASAAMVSQCIWCRRLSLAGCGKNN